MRERTWAAISAIWTAFALSVVIAITIPDYPRDVPLWKAVFWDANGFFHELMIVVGAYIAGCALIAFAMTFAKLRDLLSALEAFLEGPWE